MSLKTFLAARNIEFSLRRYGVEALNYMTLGLFGSLVIGLILKTVGGWTGIEALVEAGRWPSRRWARPSVWPWPTACRGRRS
jgi:Predicted membrane protein, putative toxin regulator